MYLQISSLRSAAFDDDVTAEKRLNMC